MKQSDIQPGDQLPMRQYFSILWANRWIILVVVAVTMAAAAYQTSKQEPTYTSDGKIWILPVNYTLGTGEGAEVNIATELELARSEQVGAMAATTLGDPKLGASVLGGWSVMNTPGTEIIEFDYTAADARTAQANARALSEGYLELRRQQAQEALLSSTVSLQERLADVREDLAAQNSQLLNAAAAGNDAKVRVLQPRVDSLTGQLGVLRQQLASLNTPESLRVGQLVEPAGPATESLPSPTRNGALALLVGLLLGAGIAFLKDHLDERVQDPGDLEYHSGSPMLAAIPTVAAWRRRKDVFLASYAQPDSAASEAYNALRAALIFSSSRHGFKTILTTSPGQGQGKTSTTANIAFALAKAGKRVTVVDADLRRSRLHLFLRAPHRPGLSDVLRGERKLAEALVHPVGAPPGLRLLPCGTSAMNPAELLGSSAMRDTIASLAEVSDFVLIDTAPILGIADALAIAPFVDTVLLVVDGQSTTIGDLRTARQRLDQLETSIVGSVLNRYNLASARRHYYSYRAPVSNGHAQPTQPIDLTAAPWVALQDKVSVSEGTPPQNKD